MNKDIYYGVAYYPEQKTEEELQHDLKLITESGINTVRMAEFAWSTIEPSEGEYHFDWLINVINYLGENGVKSVICTPTACPPVWLVKKHPEILYVDNRGVTRPFGGRRIYCYNNEIYRQYSERIAEKIGEVFGKNPYVIGFQIDNEPAQEATGRCACPVCRKKFREYLKKKYRSIREYNKKSLGTFWSQEYESFDDIDIPITTIEVGGEDALKPQRESPTLRLEFERFASDSQIEYHTLQVNALKKYTSRPVTTNTTGLATNSIDYYKGCKTLDCYAFDYYPDLRGSFISSFPYAFGRHMKKDVPFWVLEFQAGGGHSLGGTGRLQPYPGMLKLATLHAMANGAEMLLHFQFRTFPGGAEQLNYAIVDMDGQPRRRYFEMKETAALLKQLEPVFRSKFKNKAAICFDYNTLWALKIKPINKREFDYIQYCERLYYLLKDIGIQSDVIPYTEDLAEYSLVILPAAFIFTEEMQAKFTEYVRNGGVLLATFLTSVKNEHNVGYTTPLPAGMQEVTGITVEELEPVLDGYHEKVELFLEEKYTCSDGIWSEMLGGSAKAVGIYASGYKKGRMVISENQFGKGRCFYIGTDLPDEQMKAFLSYAAKSADIEPQPVKVPDIRGTEVIERILDNRRIYFLFNCTDQAVYFELSEKMSDYGDGSIYENTVPVPARSYKILECQFE
ncbi:MAG: beta-galactosidase [Clostridiaceae bacterium]|nr:beta-galactosidase [Clostridiaceae bacterium]